MPRKKHLFKKCRLGMQKQTFDVHSDEQSATQNDDNIGELTCTQIWSPLCDHYYCLPSHLDSDSPDEDGSDPYNQVITTLTEPVGKQTLPNIEECDIEEQEVHSTVFLTLVSEVKANVGSEYAVCYNDTKLSLMQMYTSGRSSSVKLSLEIKADFTCNLYVHRKIVSRGHPVWNNLPWLFDRPSVILEMCQRLLSYQVCSGNPDQDFVSLVSIGEGFPNSMSPGIIAYREGDFNAAYNSTIRSTKCCMLIQKNFRRKRCVHCAEYRGALKLRIKRLESKRLSKRKFIHTNYKHCDMSIEDMVQKIEEQKEEICALQTELKKKKREFDKVITTNEIPVKKLANLNTKLKGLSK